MPRRRRLRHRDLRRREVQAALRVLGMPASTSAVTVAAVVRRVYSDVPAEARPAAEQSARAQLAFLAR